MSETGRQKHYIVRSEGKQLKSATRCPNVLHTLFCYGGAMGPESEHYKSYLLRLWRVKGGELAVFEGDATENVVWRASLESTRTGEREIFSNLDEMFDFLRMQAAAEGG